MRREERAVYEYGQGNLLQEVDLDEGVYLVVSDEVLDDDGHIVGRCGDLFTDLGVAVVGVECERDPDLDALVDAAWKTYDHLQVEALRATWYGRARFERARATDQVWHLLDE